MGRSWAISVYSTASQSDPALEHVRADAGPPSADHRALRKACMAIARQLEGMRGDIEWPQRLCFAFAGRRGDMKRFMSEQPAIQARSVPSHRGPRLHSDIPTLCESNRRRVGPGSAEIAIVWPKPA